MWQPQSNHNYNNMKPNKVLKPPLDTATEWRDQDQGQSPPGTTRINILVAGASGSGKGRFIDAAVMRLSASVSGNTTGSRTPAAAITTTTNNSTATITTHNNSTAASSSKSGNHKRLLTHASDPFTAFQLAPEAWVTRLGPLVPRGSHHVYQYLFQAAPGWGSTPDTAAYLEALMRLVLTARQQDVACPANSSSRAFDSAVGGGPAAQLPNSFHACLYFLPPQGATAIDLVIMAGLSNHVPLIPLIWGPESTGWHFKRDADSQAAAVQKLRHDVAVMLADPGHLVTGLKPGDVGLPFGGPFVLLNPVDAAGTFKTRSDSWSSSSAYHRPASSKFDTSAGNSRSRFIQLPVSVVAPVEGAAADDASDWVVADADDSDSDRLSVCSEGSTLPSSAASLGAEMTWEFAATGAGAASSVVVPAPEAATAAAATAATTAAGGVYADATCQSAIGIQAVMDLLLNPKELLELSHATFESFCSRGQESGGNLEAVLAATLQPFTPRLLAGPSLLAECVSQAKKQLQEFKRRAAEQLKEVESQAAEQLLDCQQQALQLLREREQQDQQQLQECQEEALLWTFECEQRAQQQLQDREKQMQQVVNNCEQQAAQRVQRAKLEAQQQLEEAAAAAEKARQQLLAELSQHLNLQQQEAEQKLAEQQQQVLMLEHQLHQQAQRAAETLHQALQAATAEQDWALSNLQERCRQEQAEAVQQQQARIQELEQLLQQTQEAAEAAAERVQQQAAEQEQRNRQLEQQCEQVCLQAQQEVQEAQQAAAEQHWRREVLQQQLQKERHQASEELQAAQAAADRWRQQAEHLQQQLKQATKCTAQQQQQQPEQQPGHKQQEAAALDLPTQQGSMQELQAQLAQQRQRCKELEDAAAADNQTIKELTDAGRQQRQVIQQLAAELQAQRDNAASEQQQLLQQVERLQENVDRQFRQLQGQLELRRWYQQALG